MTTKFSDLQELATAAVDQDIADAGVEILKERIREISNLEKALAKAKTQYAELLEKKVSEVVEI